MSSKFRFLFTSLFLLCINSSIAQTFEQKDGNAIALDGFKLSNETSTEEIYKLLGEPDRTDGSDHIYSEKGIVVTLKEDKLVLISIILTSTGWGGTLAGTFSQDVTIDHLRVTESTTHEELEEQSNINFTYEFFDDFNGWECSTEWGGYDYTTKINFRESFKDITFYFFSFI